MRAILIFFLFFSFMVSGCKKDSTDEDIHNALIGRWYEVRKSSDDECVSLNWREYKEDGTYAEYYECDGKIQVDNAGTWRVEDKFLILKAKIFQMNVWWKFRYLSKKKMSISRSGSTDHTEYIKE